MKELYSILNDRSIGTLNALELRQLLIYNVTGYVSSVDVEKLTNAIDLATVLHSKQTRRNRDTYLRTPYIEHPLRNTLRLVKWKMYDIDVLIASVLHDTVEDCSEIYCRKFMEKNITDINIAQEYLLKAIETEYGANVSRIVNDVTNDVELTNSPTKNDDYVKHVTSLIHNNEEAFYVKFSDYIDNAAGLWHGEDDKFIEKQATKYQPLINIFKTEISNLHARNKLKIPDSSIIDMEFKLDYTQSNMTAILKS